MGLEKTLDADSPWMLEKFTGWVGNVQVNLITSHIPCPTC